MFQRRALNPKSKDGADDLFSAVLVSEDLMAALLWGLLLLRMSKSIESQGWKFWKVQWRGKFLWVRWVRLVLFLSEEPIKCRKPSAPN